MQSHPDVARGWFKGSKDDVNAIWRNLETELNAAGPPLKSISEWKKVWCDQKKYVRHKAAQNLKFSRATGGGPNKEQGFSANEEIIYNLICMKDSVEGVSKKFGLGASGVEETLELLFDSTPDVEPKSSGVDYEETPQKPPAKKMKLDFQEDPSEVLALLLSETETPSKAPVNKSKHKPKQTNDTQNDILKEEIGIQKEMLEVMKEQLQSTKKIYRSIDRLYDLKKAELEEIKRHNLVMKEQLQSTKKIYRSIDRLYDLKKAELEEIKRHNLVMEKLRLREIEDKIEKNRTFELQELKY